MSKKKKTFADYKKTAKKYSPIVAIVVFLGLLDFFGIIDVQGKAVEIVSSRAGSKAVDGAEGKDLTPFLETNNCPMQYPWGAPRQADESIASRGLYYCGLKYASQYDPVYRVPLWSHEVLTKQDVEIPFLVPPPNQPVANEYFPEQIQAAANLSDYVGTPYVPGFLSPIEHMKINDTYENYEVRKSKITQSLKEGAMMTNSAPMDKVVRDNIWKPLELFSRQNALTYDQVFVISGPLFLGGQTLGSIGEKKISVPTHFFKIITEANNHETLAYIIPNNAAQACPGGQCNFQRFSVSLQEVERLLGIEFYPNLAPYYAAQVRKDPNEILRKKQQELADQIRAAQ